MPPKCSTETVILHNTAPKYPYRLSYCVQSWVQLNLIKSKSRSTCRESIITKLEYGLMCQTSCFCGWSLDDNISLIILSVPCKAGQGVRCPISTKPRKPKALRGFELYNIPKTPCNSKLHMWSYIHHRNLKCRPCMCLFGTSLSITSHPHVRHETFSILPGYGIGSRATHPVWPWAVAWATPWVSRPSAKRSGR